MPIGAKRVILSGGSAWSFKGSSADLDFAHSRATIRRNPASLLSQITFVNATGGTNLVPTSASGATVKVFGANIPRITPGVGILLENASTNLLLNSQAPVTQTTASLGTGSYTLWVNGSGSALASGATATITGAASATNGAPNTFTVTVAGTVTVTVTAPLNSFQLEAGTFGTSLIVTAGATATRNADNAQLTGSALTAALTAKAMFFQTFGVAGGTSPRMIAFDVNANGVFFNSSTQVGAQNSSAAGAIATIGNSNTYASTVKSAFGMDATSITAVASGGTIVTSANAWNSGTTNAYLGNASTLTRAIDGYIARCAFGPVKGQFNGAAVFP